ncbi:response regulator transcription factor [Blastopirellula sp. JC732]|uniref:Response regulator transcription factor n=1 Tax=Blastopirellula sediminis TaxID=2894196 RepID=A0A9X1MNT9_9BACT|nr:response regulator transcription factor [Blastopirellula sediminis]MCC9608329.1 response regulator transcription factor [Blastopirellula sediminis]MCC9628894.1 response regulator transcription factor [Blastopirellula sediminis]
MNCPSNKSRILIVDDHPIVCEGLTARIDSQDDLEVCGAASNVTDALTAYRTLSPDLIIVDIQLEEGNGIELIKEIHGRNSAAKMLVISAYDESLFAERALRAGALGYVNKRELQTNVISAIRTVLNGERYLSPKMTQQLVSQAITQKDSTEEDPVQRLSDRELEVFQLIGHGKTTAAIASQLQLSVHTIDTHREKLRHKLGVKNSAELMKLAVQWVLENG